MLKISTWTTLPLKMKVLFPSKRRDPASHTGIPELSLRILVILCRQKSIVGSKYKPEAFDVCLQVCILETLRKLSIIALGVWTDSYPGI
jgi:hypothetical protein